MFGTGKLETHFKSLNLLIAEMLYVWISLKMVLLQLKSLKIFRIFRY